MQYSDDADGRVAAVTACSFSFLAFNPPGLDVPGVCSAHVSPWGVFVVATCHPTIIVNPTPFPAAMQGVYVLQDNGFRWLQRLAPPTSASGAAGDPAREEALRRLALSYLHVPCGIVRGALCHLGVVCTVEPDPKALPSCECRVWAG